MLAAALTFVGLSHASSVMPFVRSSEAASGIETSVELPLNWSAPPYLPVFVQVPFCTVPLLPLPDESLSVVPEPSSNEYAATGAFGDGAGAGAGWGCGAGAGLLPAAAFMSVWISDALSARLYTRTLSI